MNKVKLISTVGIANSATAKQLKEFRPIFKTSTPSHCQVLELMLKEIEPLEFREIAGLDDGKSLQKRHYSVSIIENLLTIAAKNKWGVCAKNGYIYLFNGNYWKVIAQDEFSAFLGNVALKSGMNSHDALHHQFKDELLDQFISQSIIATSSISDDGDQKVLINLKNGTFEITPTSRFLRDAKAEDFLKYQLPFYYDQTASAPMFQAFLDRVLPDKECQMVMSEYAGYLFTRHLKLEKVLLLYGSGANGKSVYYDVLNALLGRDNVCSYSLESLTKGNSYERVELQNKLVNYSSEISGKLESDKFKKLASGEPIGSRQIYGKPFLMENYAKLIFNTNELPYEVEHSNAFFRRFIIIPFLVSIPPHEQDIHLANKIIYRELAGVFNWVLDGLERLLKNNAFTESGAAKAQLEEYKKQTDSVLMFLDENSYTPSFGGREMLDDMYKLYRNFCVDGGYYCVNKSKFARRLRGNGYTVVRWGCGTIVRCDKQVITE